MPKRPAFEGQHPGEGANRLRFGQRREFGNEICPVVGVPWHLPRASVTILALACNYMAVFVKSGREAGVLFGGQGCPRAIPAAHYCTDDDGLER